MALANVRVQSRCGAQRGNDDCNPGVSLRIVFRYKIEREKAKHDSLFNCFSNIQSRFSRNALRFQGMSAPHGFRQIQKPYQSRVSIDEVR